MSKSSRFPILARASIGSATALAACMALGVAARSSPAAGSSGNSPAADQQVDFATQIQPIFKQSCVRCHGARPQGRGPGGPGGPGPGPGGPGPGPGRPAGPGGPGGPGRGPMGPGGGLRLDSKDAAMKGGKHGKAILPGNADDSLLYKVLKGSAEVDGDQVHMMPKGRPGQESKPLPDDKIDRIKHWIDQGANWGT